MSVAAIKPTSPGRRGMVLVKQDNLYKGSPYKPLAGAQKTVGRTQQSRAYYFLASRWRSQAPLSGGGFFSEQRRRVGESGAFGI